MDHSRDLSKLKSLPSDLGLIILTTNELDRVICHQSDDVACAVHPRAMKIFDKALGVRPIVISIRDQIPSHTKLPRNTSHGMCVGPRMKNMCYTVPKRTTHVPCI